MNGHPHLTYDGSTVDTRVDAGEPFSFDVTVVDGNGAETDADGDVALSLRDSGGTEVATDTQTANNGTVGVYTFQLNAPSKLDTYAAVVTWQVNGLDYSESLGVDVVGAGRPSSLARALEVINTRLPDDVKAAPSDAQRVRQVVEDWFQASLGFPTYVRGLRSEQYLHGERSVRVRGATYLRDVVELEVEDRAGDVYTTWTATDVRVRQRKLEAADGRNLPRGYARILVEHGMPLGRDMERAFEQFVQHVGTPQNLPDRTTSVTDQGVTYSLSLPSVARPTGLPEVDAVLNRYRMGAFI